jgi:hypothetical protein
MNASRFGMYGKEALEDFEPTTFYHFENTIGSLATKMMNDMEKIDLQPFTMPRGRFSPAYFQWMYNTIGKDYKWWYFSQLKLSEIEKYLENKHCFSLMYGATPVGFSMLEVENNGDINLSYFGLTPYGLSLKSKGLGTKFLKQTLKVAFRMTEAENKFWLYTTNRDHPAAIPTYTKVGLLLTETKVEKEWIPNQLLE